MSNNKKLQNIMENNYALTYQSKRENLLFAKCAITDKIKVKKYIMSLSKNFKMSHYYDSIYDGLTFGLHYDIIQWCITENIFNNKYKCNCLEPILQTIKKNCFQTFLCIFENYFGNKKEQLINANTIHYFQMYIRYCIDYKRVDMLDYFLKHLKLNRKLYDTFLGYAINLKFDEIVNVIKLHEQFIEDFKS